MMPNNESQNLWEAIGGLKANVQRLLEGQKKLEDRLENGLAETKRGLENGLAETKRGLDETNRKFDRLLYTVIGVGGAIIALLIMEIVTR